MQENKSKDEIAELDKSALVVEKTESGSKVFDIIEYIELSAKSGKDSTIAQKILKLKEYGITDEQIAIEYKKNAGTVENESTISSNLESIYVGLAEYINNLPNGIVIDLSTAKINFDKSYEQAIQYGTFSDDFIEDFEEFQIEGFTSFILSEESEPEGVEWIDSLDLSDFGDSNLNPAFDDIDKFMNKNEDEMNLSETNKENVKENKLIIQTSCYEEDKALYEISLLQIELRKAKKTQDFEFILNKINKFYEKNPEYVVKELPILNSDGTLNEEEVGKLNEYREAYEKIIILDYIDTINDMTQEKVENLDSKEKRHMAMCAFSGLRYKDSTKEEEQEIARESFKTIRKLYPELNLDNKEEIANFFNENFGVKIPFESFNLDNLIEIYSRQLKESTNLYIQNDKQISKGNKIDLSNLDLDSSSRKVFDSAMGNYFIGSNIEFSKTEEDLYRLMYQDYTIDSWIQSKDDAIKLRYIALMYMREEYKTLKPSEYVSKKMENLERSIEEFEKEFGKFEITEEQKEEFLSYKDNFINAGITKYITRDILEWQEGKNYQDLDSKHKKGYMLNVLAAISNLNKEDSEQESCIYKLALRRLELMNTEDKKFVEFEDGDPKINEELILEEYNKMSSHKFLDFEELKYFATLRKNEYLLNKLDEYTHLDPSAFLELDDNSDRETSMEQIEERRKESNQQRIEESAKSLRYDDAKIPEEVLDGFFDTMAIEMDVSALNLANTSRQVRDEVFINQQELGINDFIIPETSEVSNRKLTVENMVIDDELEKEESEKKSFFGIIKNAYKTVKMFISKHIKRENEPQLLDTGLAGNDETKTGNVTNIVDTKDPFSRVETPIITAQAGKTKTSLGLDEKDQGR